MFAAKALAQKIVAKIATAVMAAVLHPAPLRKRSNYKPATPAKEI
jgi:hypothetical protein